MRVRQATELVSPWAERTAWAPVLASRKAPVPKVHLARPGWVQPSASSAACWSTTRPPTAIGVPNALWCRPARRRPRSGGAPRPASRTARGARGSQATLSRPVSRDRLAVDASVTSSPQRWWTSQLSVVVTTPSVVTLRRSQAILGAEKYGSRTRPVRSATQSEASCSSATSGSARRSCQTIADDSGAPVTGSQASTVSPWLASDTQATGRPADARARRPAVSTEASSSAGSCSTPPPGRYAGCTGSSATATTPSTGSMTIALVPDVPWSIARTACVVTKAPSRWTRVRPAPVDVAGSAPGPTRAARRA